MKSWDEIVFNKKFQIPKIRITQNLTQIRNQNKKNIKTQNLKTEKKNTINQIIEYYEVEYVQSKHKIILISGPPGIGKTTIANVIFRQCGYDPIIINSSDQRTYDKLITRIYDTTLINNLNLSKKINLLVLIQMIIDGISSDFIGKNSIKNIIDLIKNGKLNKAIFGRNKKEVLNDFDNKIIKV